MPVISLNSQVVVHFSHFACPISAPLARKCKRVGCIFKGTLYDTGYGFPAFVPHGDGIVFGELIEVDDATFKRIDRLEGYPNLYTRIPISYGDWKDVYFELNDEYLYFDTGSDIFVTYPIDIDYIEDGGKFTVQKDDDRTVMIVKKTDDDGVGYFEDEDDNPTWVLNRCVCLYLM